MYTSNKSYTTTLKHNHTQTQPHSYTTTLKHFIHIQTHRGSTAGSPRGSDARPLSPVQRERHGKLQVELGEGEGVSALLEKSYTANGMCACLFVLLHVCFCVYANA